MAKKIYEIEKNKRLRIPLEVNNVFFEKININKETNYLMDVKRKIFDLCDIAEEPVMTIQNARKTLAEQEPNNAYGIPITDHEANLFMERFGLKESDEFTEISKHIISLILNS